MCFWEKSLTSGTNRAIRANQNKTSYGRIQKCLEKRKIEQNYKTYGRPHVKVVFIYILNIVTQRSMGET